MVLYGVLEQANQCVNQSTLTLTAENGTVAQVLWPSIALVFVTLLTDFRTGWVTDLMASSDQSGHNYQPPTPFTLLALICTDSIFYILIISLYSDLHSCSSCIMQH